MSNEDVIPFPVRKTAPQQGERALRLVPQEGCRHRRHYLVDETSNTIECADCHIELAPMWVIMELMDRESLYLHHYERYAEMARKLEKRIRTVCQHCGRVTRIKGI